MAQHLSLLSLEQSNGAPGDVMFPPHSYELLAAKEFTMKDLLCFW